MCFCMRMCLLAKSQTGPDAGQVQGINIPAKHGVFTEDVCASPGPGAIRYFEQFPDVKPFGSRNSFHNKVCSYFPAVVCICMQLLLLGV